MGVRFEIIQSAAPTTSGTQDFVFSGFGTPKAAILIASYATANGSDASHAVLSIGLTDGTRQFAIGGSSEDAIGTSDTFGRISNSGCLLMLEPLAGGNDGEANFSGWITDGLRIDWSNFPSAAFLITAILIGGDDLTAYVGDFTSTATVGNSVSITDPQFEPDQLIVLGAGARPDYNTTLANAQFNVGFVDNGVSIVQHSSNMRSVDAAGSADIANNVSTLYASSFIASTDIEISNFNSLGFDAITRTVTGGWKHLYLALAYSGVVDHWVGMIDSPIASGNASVTTPDFNPQFVLHCPNAVITVDGDRSTEATGAGAFSIAAFTDDNSYTIGVEDEDGPTTMRTRSFTDSKPVNYDSGAGTNLHNATFVSFDPSGWTLNYTVANSTIRKWPTLVVEEFVAAINDSIELFISGPIVASGDIDLFITGPIVISGDMDLFINGNTSFNEDINLFVIGPVLATSGIDLFIVASGDFESWNLFLKTPENDIATSRKFTIYGSPSGTNFGFTGDELDLFIKSSILDSVYPPLTSGYNSLFLKAESDNNANTGYWPLFLNSNTVTNDSIELFITTFDKSSSGSIDLFIARIPDFPGQEGATPINDNWTLFLKTLNGSIDNIDIFIEGIPISGTLINIDINLFIEGIIIINDSLDLLLFGVLGIPNNDIDLYEFGIDDINKNIKLFIRGC